MTRGSFWTPEAQDLALARSEVRGRLCPCGCGNKAVDTQREPGDQDAPPMDVHTKVCVAKAAVDAVRRAAFDEDPKAQPAVQPTDGLLIWATPGKEHP